MRKKNSSPGKKFEFGKKIQVGQKKSSWGKKFELGLKIQNGQKIQVRQKNLSGAKEFELGKKIRVGEKIQVGHDSLLAAKKNGACSSRQIHSNSPQTYTESGQDGGKKILLHPLGFSLKNSDGVWVVVVVVVDRFTIAYKRTFVT